MKRERWRQGWRVAFSNQEDRPIRCRASMTRAGRRQNQRGTVPLPAEHSEFFPRKILSFLLLEYSTHHTMKQCAACCTNLSKDCFSNKRWKLKEYQRRCKECVTKDEPVKKVARPKPDAPSCWICLENGKDDSGQPVVQGCSCRGDAGHADISCLTQYAETKSMQHFEKDDPERITDPWNECPNCEQEYNRNGVGTRMADGFVSFSRRKFAKALDFVALTFKLRKMKLECCDDKEDNKALARDDKQLAKDILSKVRKRRGKGESSSEYLSCFEKECYYRWIAQQLDSGTTL